MKKLVKNKISKIFLDLDGVLADFQPHADKVTAMYHGDGFRYEMREFKRNGASQEARDKYWDSMYRYELAGGRFWEELDVLDDAHELWEYVNSLGLTVEVLTAIGDAKYGAREQKVKWVNKHFGAPVIHTVRRGDMKASFATPDSILIDDMEYACEPFIEAGGTAILHRRTNDTIQKLETLIV